MTQKTDQGLLNYRIPMQKVLQDQCVKDIQEQEDAEFIQHVEEISGLGELVNEDFRFASALQFMSPTERIISTAERMLTRAPVQLFSEQAKQQLAAAMSGSIRDRLREASFTRKILPPRQV